jgi:sacsin
MKPYGQQEPLTRRIHSILRDYPAGTQIMKELLQNADDARASDVTFMLDLRVGTDPRLSPRMANPSLFCYNNKPFAEKDFVSLQNLGQSCKRQDTSSTGRFGIGFNSVYNLTDYVAFVTGSSFVLFDPHRHFVQGDTGERMDFVEDRIDSLSPDKSALASCFKLFGNDMQSPFSGTLFRFPLRSAALAQYSEISSAHYDGPSMLRLFRRFITEASNDCLFLKFVRRISLEVWEDKAEQPATLFKVEVSARGPDLANRSRVALESLAATAEYSYTLTLRQTVHDALAERLFSEVPLGTDQPEAQALPRGESEQEWLFAAYCDVDGPARQYVEDIQETKDTSDLRMVPWACVAWPRPHATREAAVIEGRAYCFLPLPVITGLLPHLNSFWELSSNRRDLWKGDDMGSEASKIKGQWNTILKKHVVAPALLHLYAQIKERYLDNGAITSEQYFEDWPAFNAAESEWRDVVTSFYSLLWSSPLRLIHTQGNRWVQCGQVIEADHTFSGAQHVTQYLVSQGQQLFPAGGVWQEIIHSLRATGLQLSQVTPQLLRDVLRESDPSTISLDLEVQHGLLSYCLADGSPDLVGLPLVPVGRGGTACFGALDDEPTLFLVSKSQFHLLQEQAGERLIAVLPGDSRRELFEAIARQKSTNVRMMDHSVMAELLGQTAYAGLQTGVHQTSWHREGGLSASFVSALWDYLVEVSLQDEAAPLERWPVAATQSSTLVSLSEAGRASLLDASAADLPSNIQRAFEKLGCRFVDHTICRGKLPQGRWTLMQAEAPNLLRAAGNASGDRLAELSNQLSPDEKRALFQFLVSHAPTGASKTILQSLAIYPLCGQGDDKFGSAIRREMAELGAPEAVLDDHFIKVDGLDQRVHFLSHSVGVVKVKKHAVYTRHIFPAIHTRKLSPVQIEVVMLQVLKELHALADEDPTILDQITSMPFLRVATRSGRGPSDALLAPSDALDPGCKVLARLFGTQVLFPHGSFASPTVLPRLLEVGLQSHLTPRLFLLAVDAITRDNDVVKAEELFHILTRDGGDLLQGGDWEAAFAQVAQKPWIPSRKLTLQLVRGGPVQLNAPHKTRPKALAPLVGTSSFTAEHDDVGMRFSSLLGWDAPLPLPLVLAHWERVIGFAAKLTTLEEGPISADVCQRIKHTTMKIYDHLDSHIDQLDRPLPEPGVWTSKEFVSAHRVAWDAPEVDTAGVLMQIPLSLRRRECLAKAMKIKPAFTAADYLEVLVAICANGELAKVDTVERLLLHLANQPQDWLVVNGRKLRAPDIERTAYWPLEELAYANSTKVLRTLRSIDAPVKLISERIPRDIAAKLGAKSLSQLLEEEFSELIGVEYGQEEKLTSRIANILHNYSHEDLLKELVQNAEDAGATEFCLILDKQTHASQLLFNPMMAQFQGPSLLIYNNRTLLGKYLFIYTQTNTKPPFLFFVLNCSPLHVLRA